MQSMQETVIDVLNEVLVENGGQPYAFSGETRILSESTMDSLGLALTLVKLEERTGRDPFVSGFINFVTVTELARLYESN
jgi:hypothetical protein